MKLNSLLNTSWVYQWVVFVTLTHLERGSYNKLLYN